MAAKYNKVYDRDIETVHDKNNLPSKKIDPQAKKISKK